VTTRHLLAIVLALGIFCSAAAAPAAPLPERPPPSGFAAVNGPTGGRTLAGTFSGNARSAAAVLGGMLGALRGYFDGAPAVSSAVGDPADRGLMAFFDARLQGTPVRGAVIVQLNDGGGGGVAVLFDRPADIARSFPAMARQLGGIQVPGGRPAHRPVALQQQTTPDGKAAIGVPPKITRSASRTLTWSRNSSTLPLPIRYFAVSRLLGTLRKATASAPAEMASS
jgi:hypothetical protein